MEEGGADGEKTSPLQRIHIPEHRLPAACVPRSSLWPFHVLPAAYLAGAEGDQGSPHGESLCHLRVIVFQRPWASGQG